MSELQIDTAATMINSKAKRLFLSPPHMSGEELRLIHDAFESNYIAPLGPQVDAFEREVSEYSGIKYCVALSSGTAALHLALRVLGLDSGDEVIASTLTFIGSITPILYQGATPIFIDADRDSWNMDPDLLKNELESCEKRGHMPKAVVPTDLYGQCADYKRIYEICGKYSIPVVVDAAEAMGARYLSKQREERNKQGKTDENSDIWKHAGVGAKAAIFSFNGNKIITTSAGGMLASDDKDFIAHARFLSQQARENFSHYEHTEIGYNYRMSNILAAIGRAQIRVLDERIKRKREIFKYYKKALMDVPGIEFMPEAHYGRSNRWLTVILVSPEEFGMDREALRVVLEKENIEARPAWKPMHLQPVFRVGARNKKLKAKDSSKRTYSARVVGGGVAEDFFSRGLCLPSGTAMTDLDLDRIISVILSCQK